MTLHFVLYIIHFMCQIYIKFIYNWSSNNKKWSLNIKFLVEKYDKIYALQVSNDLNWVNNNNFLVWYKNNFGYWKKKVCCSTQPKLKNDLPIYIINRLKLSIWTMFFRFISWEGWHEKKKFRTRYFKLSLFDMETKS